MKRLFLIISLVVILGISSSWYHRYTSFDGIIGGESEKIIEVAPGSTLYGFFEEEFHLSDPLWKYYLKKHTPSDFKLQTGKFEIQANATLEDIFQNLQKPMYDSVQVTMLEGWNIFDIDAYLSNEGLLQAGDFIAFAENDFYPLKKEFTFIADAETLEGFLYPDTYALDPKNITPETIARTMLKNFQTKILPPPTSPLLSKEGESGEGVGGGFNYETLILASIVEKEERNSNERPTVAGILKKRLNEGWMIGADITVCYPHKLTSEECKMVVSKYIGEKSEYNTRTMTGLPRTPIGNPSFDAISAVIHSKDTPYYYYLHDTQTGQIYYARTNSEHEENKKKYLR